MIENYTKPQVLINEVLDIIPQPSDRTLHAMIIGPQFFLRRYTVPAEAALIPGVAFQYNTNTSPSAEQVVPYQGGLTSSMIVDQAFAALYGTNLEGELWSANSHVNPSDPNLYDFEITSINTANQLRVVQRGAVIQATASGGAITAVSVIFAGSGYTPSTTVDVPLVQAPGINGAARLVIGSLGTATSVSIISPGTGYTSGNFDVSAPSVGANVGLAGSSLIAALCGRPITPGDVIYSTFNSVTSRRIVKSVIQEVIASSFGTDTASQNEAFAASTLNPTETDAASFAGQSAPSSWGVWPNHTGFSSIDVTNNTGLTSGEALLISNPTSLNAALPAVTTLTAVGSTNIAATDTVEIGSTTYTFVTSLTPSPYQVLRGATIEASLYNLAAAINANGLTTLYGTGTVANTQVTALVIPSANNDIATSAVSVTLTAITPGTASNSIAVVSTGTGSACEILANGVAAVSKISTSTLGAIDPGTAVVGAAWPTQQAEATAEEDSLGNWSVELDVPGSGYFFGGVVRVFMSAVGSGYTSYPEVVFTAPPTGGVQAQGVAILSSGTVIGVQITDPGAGYTSAPTITFVGGGGSSAAATALISNGITFISVNTAGSGYGTGPINVLISAPNVPGGVQATAVAVLNAGTIASITITNPGSGYTGAAVAIDPLATGGSGAVIGTTVTLGTGPAVSSGSNSTSVGTLTPHVYSDPKFWNGLIQGSSYGGKYAERYTITVTSVPAQVNDTGPLVGTVRIRSASGAFSANNVALTQYGETYYISDPSLGGLTIELAPPSAGTLPGLGNQFAFTVTGKYMPLDLTSGGELLSVAVTTAGSGYSTTPTATVTAPPAGGTQATVAINLTAEAISSVTVTNPGSGYVYPPVITLTNVGGGSGAVLTPLIANPVNSRDLIVNPLDVYTGPANTQYQLTVLQGTDLGNTTDVETGAIVRVTDTAGIDQVQQYTVATGTYYPLGTYGLQFQFPAGRSTPSGLSTGTQAVAGTPVLIGEAIVSVPISNAGAGYETSPVVTVSGGGGSGAIIKAVVENGVVIDLEVVSGGSGYGTTPTVTITGAPQTYQGGLRTGDVYFINAVAATAVGPYSTIVLSGAVTDVSGWQPNDVTTNLFNIDHRLLFSGAVPAQGDDAPALSWTAGTTAQGGILVAAQLPLFVANRTSNQWVLVQNSTYGMLYATWRGLIPSSATAPIIRYGDPDDIIAAFGANDIDNPVCYGACIALEASNSKPVYVASVPTNDLTGYQSVLNQIIKFAGPAYLAPMTMDTTVQAAVKAHVDSASVANVRHFRRCYLATQNPGAYDIYSQDGSGNPLTATILSNGSGNVLVTSPNAQFITNNIQAGMTYRTQYGVDVWGNPTYSSYVIATVTDQDSLVLVTGPNAPVSPAVAFQIWGAATGTSQATFVGNVSNAFQDRRVMNTWCDSPQNTDVNGNVIVVPNYYLAAEYAGARSVLPVQMGMTRFQMQYAVTSAPLMYSNYQDSDLDIAAENGTAVITQDYSGGPVYVRHQLTTSSNNGPLYYEDSVGVSLDALAYDMFALLDPYIGARNVNLENLEEIQTGCRSLLDTYLQATPGYEELGPIIEAYGTLTVYIPANAVNTIAINITDIQFPLPIDLINLTLQGSTISAQTLITINQAVATANTAAASVTQTTSGSTVGA